MNRPFRELYAEALRKFKLTTFSGVLFAVFSLMEATSNSVDEADGAAICD